MSYRFKDARVQSGISQKDAAEQLQVSAATVNNWESGRRLPTIDALEKMADLYGVSTDYLLGRTDSSNPFRRIAESIDKDILPFLHDHPVFINNNRWGLVDAMSVSGFWMEANCRLVMLHRFLRYRRYFRVTASRKGGNCPAMKLEHTSEFGWNPFPKMKLCVRKCAAGIQ